MSNGVKSKLKRKSRIRRHRRVRAKVYGTAKVPRLSVRRSNKHIYCQLVNDEKGITLISASDLEIKGKAQKGESDKSRQVEVAYLVGKLIAQKALEQKLKKVVFDRGYYKYHGRIRALAEGARAGGLVF